MAIAEQAPIRNLEPSAQSQLAYATERLVLSTHFLAELHQDLNEQFYQLFGHNNLSDNKRDTMECADGALPMLLGSIEEMHYALDEVRADIGFFKEQNL